MTSTPMGWTGYVDHLVGRRLADKTTRRYVRWVRDADEWLKQRGASLETATPTLIRAWADEQVAFSHASRGQAAAALKHYWQWCGVPPVGGIIIPADPQYACRAISEEQARDVVKVALGWWPEGTAVLCGLYLALRRMEVAQMEWSRFTSDLAWYTVTGKRNKTAELPVNPILAAELQPRRSDGWVFSGRFGAHVHETTIGNWTRRVGEAAGLTHLEPHELRHTAIARVNDNLGDLRAAQTFARHDQPNTTRIYTRTTRTRLREAAEALNYLDTDMVVCPHCGAA